MSFSLRKQLAAFLLLVAVLLAPLTSFAHEVASGAAETCACNLMPEDCGTDEGDPSDDCPDTEGQKCCDCEDHCTQAAELSSLGDLRPYLADKIIFRPILLILIPEVYLPIFVPPQICSFG
jgi:hypothetical protein